VFGRARGGRLVGGVRPGGGAYRQGSGRPGAPTDGAFRPSRDLASRREAFAAGAPSGSLVPARGRPIRAWADSTDDVDTGPADDLPLRPIDASATVVNVRPARPVVPGERRFRDGDHVRHERLRAGPVRT